MSVVAVSYPFWAVVGGVLGLLYRISVNEAPGRGIGSPNFIFTLLVIVATAIFATPFVVIIRGRASLGILSIAITFMGIFGWLLPYFAA